MANTIVLKRSATPGKVPTTSQLSLGEIAINTYDGLIYIKKDDGTPSVVQIGGVTSVNGETGAVTIDTTDVAENGNLYFTQARARASISAGSGISYNSSTGAISTTQTLTTAGSPTFVNLTLTGGIPSISGDIIPSADITYDLGSPTKQWKDIYVGPGSLYVNGSKVLEDDTGTITFSADIDQNIRIKTLGTGILQLGSSTTNINIDGTLQIAAGKNITDSAGIKVNFGDNIEMNGNKVIGLGAPSSSTDAATKGYVDTAIGAVSTSSISQGNSNIAVVDTGTGTVTVTVDGSTALTVNASGVTVAGDFTVSGTTTTVNSNTVSLADNILTLNSDTTGAPSQNAGVEVERGDETNVQLRWNEGSDTWTFTNDGAVYYPMATGTDTLAEGSTNLYHTAGRARSAISASSGTGVSYNSTTGAISLGSIPNSSLSNSTVTIGSTSTSLGATSTTLAGLSSVTSSSFIGELTGNASTATKLATARTLALTGDATASGSFDGSANYSQALTLATVNSNVGQFGSATAIPVVTVNAKGLITAISTTAVSIPSGALTFTGDVTGTGTTGSSTALTIKSSPTLTTPTLSGTTTVSGNLVPSADLTYDLGSSSSRFRNLYLSGSTIAIAGSTSGTLTLASPAVAGTTTVTFPATTGTVITTGDTGTVTSTMIADGTIVNGDINASAAIVDTKLATISTAGKVSNSATTATNANTVSAIVARDASGNFSAGTITANLTGAVTGNATTATTLATARAIQGVNFDGSAAITVVTAGTGITVTGTAVAVDSTIATKTYVDSAVAGKDNTDEITEGSTNLFFTNARARSAVSFTAGSGAYNSSTGVITIPTNTNQLTNGAGFATEAFVTSAVAGKDNTDEITEGSTNLFFTNARARSALSGSTGISYNSSTGAISSTITQYTDAAARGAVSFTAGSGAYNSSTGVFTIPTNTNQLTNGAGFITGYTETSTLAAVTGRGATTTSAMSTGALTVTGGITASGEITAYFSDERLKMDINPIQDALSKVMAIGGYTYKANELAHELGVSRYDNQIGLLAQEVEAVMPELVTQSGLPGYKTIRYDKVVSVLVEAIKEQQAMIEELRRDVKKTLH